MLYVTETPTVYSTAGLFLPILSAPVTWFRPFLSGIGQLLLYRLKIKPRELKTASGKTFKKFILEMDDGTELAVAISSKGNRARGVVLYLHTVCGDYTQLAHMSEMFYNDGIAYVSYTRSGGDKTMKFSKYNFIGRIDELQSVLKFITNLFPHTDIHAIGGSAGAALLIRYLGKYNQRKLIKSAAMISPGYDFTQSMSGMNIVTSTYLVNKMKYIIRHLPSTRELDRVRTMDDWVQYQSTLLGFSSKEEFVRECNPTHYLDKINVPTMFISALDDSVFDGEITKMFLKLPTRNPNITMITTERGGHVMFEDVGHDMPWFLRVFHQWIHYHIETTCSQ